MQSTSLSLQRSAKEGCYDNSDLERGRTIQLRRGLGDGLVFNAVWLFQGSADAE